MKDAVRVTASLDEVVRPPGPALVQVEVANASVQPAIVNARLAVGYRDSDSRELFAEVHEPGGHLDVSRQRKRYERDLPAPDDYVTLAPGASVAGSFDLLDWYVLPGFGAYEFVVFYQGDEPLALQVPGLLPGTYASDPVPFRFADAAT